MKVLSISTRFVIVAAVGLTIAVIWPFQFSSARSRETIRLTSFANSLFGPSSNLLAAADKISPQALADTASGTSSIVILLADQADVSLAYEIEDQDARGWFVYNTLTEHAKSSQASLISFLKEGDTVYRSFWAANMIVAEANQALAVQIAGRSDVARVDSNRPARWIEEPKISQTGVGRSSINSPDAVEWGIANVNAPSVWALGANGSGIVVGGLDTGIRWTHDAIKSQYRGWNGTVADHNYNWHDAIHSGGGSCGPDTLAPCDDFGHGSHTLGTMVGDDGAGNQIGVAPGARWVGCRNMNQGNGTPASYSECFQFMIAPTDLSGTNPNPTLRPHIVNNSWGCPASEGCTTRAELEAIVNNTQAAGIFVQASAGNSGGGGCSTVSQALAIYDASFSAGAIDINNSLTGFSSRGPSTYYDPALLKPNISAPGSNVRSISGFSDNGYSPSSGTSMASPHVAGVVALLWSARPSLVRNIAATKALLQNTANPNVTAPAQTCGGTSTTQIPNNIFGYGRVDALTAFNASAARVEISGQVLSPNGLALRNMVVTLTDANSVRRTATTSSFGNYTFANVIAASNYVLGVSSKRYRFAPRLINVSENLSSVTFVGLE